MFSVSAHSSLRGRARRVVTVAALAIAFAGAIGSVSPASANHEVVNCAVGGDLADGGSVAVGCTVGGFYGTAIAGTIDVSDPAMTVAGAYGAPCGYPASNIAGVIDVADPSVVYAGGDGGYFPYAAESYAGVYP